MTNPIKYILFKLADQTFAVEVQQVISIERMQHITRVPRTSDFIKGVTSIRKETTAIIDLKERLHMQVSNHTDETRLLIVTIEDMQVGLIVDTATEVKDIDSNDTEPPPKIIAGVKDTFLKGVATVDEKLILIIDVEKILDFEETNQVKEALID